MEVWGARESEAGGAQASRPLPIGKGRAGACGNNGGGMLMHVGHFLDMRHPLWRFTKHMVGSDMGKVGTIFGPAMGQFG